VSRPRDLRTEGGDRAFKLRGAIEAAVATVRVTLAGDLEARRTVEPTAPTARTAAAATAATLGRAQLPPPTALLRRDAHHATMRARQ
jgi:hypothetical protein